MQAPSVQTVEKTTLTPPTPITVAYGDGIGPEIMEATLEILKAAGANINAERIEIGEKVYLQGNTTGIGPEAWDSLERTRVFLKAPITTPQGGGYKSLNVTTRKTLGLFANVRPCVSYHPFIATKHPVIDMVIVRENEEDLYAGIEHQQTDEVTQCLKLISRPGSEKIIRFAFEYARQYGRKKVTCLTKDNIMKLTDGLFHKVFNEVALEYPEIQTEHLIIDIGAARIANNPERFDVALLPNLYGDIASDIAAEITGSVGLGGSANIGQDFAMFEAIHGSAPDIAGKGIANPSGLLLGAVQMLVYIGQPQVAQLIHNAWLKTIEDGIHTGDIYNPSLSKERVDTKGFTQAVIERLGQEPSQMQPVHYAGEGKRIEIKVRPTIEAKKELYGVDVFLHHKDRNAETLGKLSDTFQTENLHMQMITNRGVRVYPGGHPATFCSDHWRLRYLSKTPVHYAEVLKLQEAIDQAGLDIIKTENLYYFDGKAGFSLAQGE